MKSTFFALLFVVAFAQGNLLLNIARYNTINQLFTGLLQVNANATLNGAPYPDVFTQDVKFKTHPLIPNGDLDLAREYLFGLTAAEFFGASVTDFTIQNFQINEQDEAWCKTILHYTYPGGVIASNITLLNQFRFSSQVPNRTKIQEFELAALNLEAFWQDLGLDYNQQFIKDFLIADICNIHDQYCVGSLKQYNDTQHCLDVLNAKRFGNPGFMTDDTIVCRQLHSQMVIVKPSHHCPHISESGGGKCRIYTGAEIHAPLFNSEPRLIY